MKDNSAFIESVFSKSEKIFEKRKKRKKTFVSVASASICLVLTIGIFSNLPIGKKSFDAESAPQKNHYSDAVNIEIKEEYDLAGDKESTSVKIPEKTLSSPDEILAFDIKMPKRAEIVNFSSTASVYMAEKDILAIKEALDTYFESVHDTNATGTVSFYYNDEKLTIYVGNEFFEIYKNK